MKKSEKLSEIQNCILKLGNALNDFGPDEDLQDEKINQLQSEIADLKELNMQFAKNIEDLNLQIQVLRQKIEQISLEKPTPSFEPALKVEQPLKLEIKDEPKPETTIHTATIKPEIVLPIEKTTEKPIEKTIIIPEVESVKPDSEPSLFVSTPELHHPQPMHSATPAPEKKTVAEQFIHEKQSINELFTQQKTELNNRFQNIKVQDLTKAIGINDKFLFIKELFNNKGEEFSRAINQLNTFNSIDEAFDYLDQLKVQYFWEDTNSAYLKLCDLLRRKFV